MNTRGSRPAPIALALALACLAVLPAAQAADDSEQLIATDKKMQRAFVERDLKTLEQVFTDDYVLVVSSGAERRKADILKEVASPDTHWEINETSGWEVRVHGDTAMVLATLHQKGVDHGKAFDSNVKFSDTYVRENGAWRNLHGHACAAVPVK